MNVLQQEHATSTSLSQIVTGVSSLAWLTPEFLFLGYQFKPPPGTKLVRQACLSSLVFPHKPGALPVSEV